MDTYILTKKDLQELANKTRAARLERELASFCQSVRNSVLRAARDGYYQIIQPIPEELANHVNVNTLRLTFPDADIKVDATMVFVSWA